MKKRYMFLTGMLICLLLVSCIPAEIVDSEKEYYKIEVRGLSLKYILIGASYDLLTVNVQMPDYFNAETFKKAGKESYEYYEWLCKTYSAFPDDKKMN